MEKIQKKKREFYLGVKNSFLLGLPVLGIIYILAKLESNRTRTTLIILSIFIALELILIIKQKRTKEYTIPFLSGFVGGIIFLTVILWPMIFHS